MSRFAVLSLFAAVVVESVGVSRARNPLDDALAEVDQAHAKKDSDLGNFLSPHWKDDATPSSSSSEEGSASGASGDAIDSYLKTFASKSNGPDATASFSATAAQAAQMGQSGTQETHSQSLGYTGGYKVAGKAVDVDNGESVGVASEEGSEISVPLESQLQLNTH